MPSILAPLPPAPRAPPRRPLLMRIERELHLRHIGRRRLLVVDDWMRVVLTDYAPASGIKGGNTKKDMCGGGYGGDKRGLPQRTRVSTFDVYVSAPNSPFLILVFGVTNAPAFLLHRERGEVRLVDVFLGELSQLREVPLREEERRTRGEGWERETNEER